MLIFIHRVCCMLTCVRRRCNPISPTLVVLITALRSTTDLEVQASLPTLEANPRMVMGKAVATDVVEGMGPCAVLSWTSSGRTSHGNGS